MSAGSSNKNTDKHIEQSKLYLATSSAMNISMVIGPESISVYCVGS